MGQPQSTVFSTSIVYSPTGICTTSLTTATTCAGNWKASTNTCSEWVPTLNAAGCNAGTWKAVPGQTQPPLTVVFTSAPTPAPTADPACACTSGQGCAQSSCNSCLISKVCTNVFPTKDECLTIPTKGGKWCGN